MTGQDQLSPRRDNEARGSDVPMTADQRLDQLLVGAGRGNTPRGGGPGLRNQPLESSPPNPVSPSMAAQMMSPPRELTRAMPVSAQNISITDITSDENGRDVIGDIRNPNDRNHPLNHEVVEMTQRHLTSEFEIAEFANRVTEAEIRRNLEYELSQEIHLFDQARHLIGEMREKFSIEDQGCIRRIEMLETQRDECAAGLVE